MPVAVTSNFFRFQAGSAQPGDILVFRRFGYCHYAISLGNGKVIHRGSRPCGSSFICKSSKAEIREDRLEDVVCGCDVITLNSFESRYSPEERVERARRRLGETGYDLVANNCEHFVTWCCFGIETSLQVDRAGENLVVGSTLTLSVGAVYQVVSQAIDSQMTPAASLMTNVITETKEQVAELAKEALQECQASVLQSVLNTSGTFGINVTKAATSFLKETLAPGLRNMTKNAGFSRSSNGSCTLVSQMWLVAGLYVPTGTICPLCGLPQVRVNTLSPAMNALVGVAGTTFSWVCN